MEPSRVGDSAAVPLVALRLPDNGKGRQRRRGVTQLYSSLLTIALPSAACAAERWQVGETDSVGSV